MAKKTDTQWKPLTGEILLCEEYGKEIAVSVDEAGQITVRPRGPRTYHPNWMSVLSWLRAHHRSVSAENMSKIEDLAEIERQGNELIIEWARKLEDLARGAK